MNEFWKSLKSHPRLGYAIFFPLLGFIIGLNGGFLRGLLGSMPFIWAPAWVIFTAWKDKVSLDERQTER